MHRGLRITVFVSLKSVLECMLKTKSSLTLFIIEYVYSCFDLNKNEILHLF